MAPIRDDFGSVRPIRRLNRLTQALLAIALAVVVNFLASLPEFRLRTTSLQTDATRLRPNPPRPSEPPGAAAQSALVAIKAG